MSPFSASSGRSLTVRLMRPEEGAITAAALCDEVVDEATIDEREADPTTDHDQGTVFVAIVQESADGQDAERIVGVCRTVMVPGRIASLRLPRLMNLPADSSRTPLAADIVGKLLEAVNRYHRQQSIAVAFTSEVQGEASDFPRLTNLYPPPPNEILEKHGWRAAATLLIQAWFAEQKDLTSSSDSWGDRHEETDPTARLTLPGFDSDKSLRLCPVVERSAGETELLDTITRTYVESLDCPLLDGIRDVADVLEGYRATGKDRHNRWWILRHQDRPVGCLILGEHDSTDAVELIYLGLVPEARGHRWGQGLIAAAQAMTCGWNRAMLFTSVDAANEPALAQYRSQGFEILMRRALSIWSATPTK